MVNAQFWVSFLECLFVPWIPYWFQWKTKIDFISQEGFWKLSDIENEANDEWKNIYY